MQQIKSTAFSLNCRGVWASSDKKWKYCISISIVIVIVLLNIKTDQLKYKRIIINHNLIKSFKCVRVITTALQRESLIKVQTDRTDLRRRMRDMEQKLQHERQDHRDVNSGTVQAGHESTISVSFNNLR